MRFTTMEAARSTVREPVLGRSVQLGNQLERLLERRRLQHDAWVERAQMWERNRPASVGPVQFPRDEAAVIALGVPCVDCLVLVCRQGESGGTAVAEVAEELADLAALRGFDVGAPAGHVVTFRVVPGRHWAEHVAARCAR